MANVLPQAQVSIVYKLIDCPICGDDIVASYRVNFSAAVNFDPKNSKLSVSAADPAVDSCYVKHECKADRGPKK